MAKIKNAIEKADVFLFREKTHYLHIGDLVSLYDGEMTTGQYIIASRILDIMLFKEGKSFFWYKYFYRIQEKDLTAEEEKQLDESFTNLILSLQTRGISMDAYYLSASRSPFLINNGTHRLAYCIINNPNSYLPVRICDSRPWFDARGEAFLRKYKVPDSTLSILKNKYSESLSTIRTCISGICPQDSPIINFIRQYGTVIVGKPFSIDLKDSAISIKKKYWKRIKKLGKTTILPFTLDLNHQKLYVSWGNIHSLSVKELFYAMSNCIPKQYLKRTVIAETVTDSIALELFFESINGFHSFLS